MSRYHHDGLYTENTTLAYTGAHAARHGTPDEEKKYYTTLGPAIALIRDNPEKFMREFYPSVFALDFSTRDLFPPSMNNQNGRFQRGLLFILETIDAATQDPEEIHKLTDFLSHLGRDHRKYHITAEHYDLMTRALRQTLAHQLGDEWTEEMEKAVTTAFETASRVMVRAAEEDTTPATYEAEVLDVLHITRDVAIVRVKATPAIQYLPGQYMSVQIPQCPRTWRYLSAAIPANPDGYIEFHIRALEKGFFSRAVVHNTTPGDKWLLSRPLGTLHVTGDEPVCMIARNVSLAPMRCILLDMVQNRTNNPITDIYYGTRYPGELFEATTLANLQAANPWLIAHVCSEETTDPWWLKNAGELPPNLLLRQGNPLDLAIADGTIHNRDIIIGGGPAMVNEGPLRLQQRGVDPSRIMHDPV